MSYKIQLFNTVARQIHIKSCEVLLFMEEDQIQDKLDGQTSKKAGKPK